MKSRELEDCIKRKKIVAFSKAPSLVEKELKLAKEDFKTAKESLESKNYRWAVIQSYYSMFHSARALIYRKGYREKSHFCLAQALREFYVSKGLLDFSFLESLSLGKTLRENADYYGDFDAANAKELVYCADKFIKKARLILKTSKK